MFINEKCKLECENNFQEVNLFNNAYYGLFIMCQLDGNFTLPESLCKFKGLSRVEETKNRETQKAVNILQIILATTVPFILLLLCIYRRHRWIMYIKNIQPEDGN